MALLFPVVFNSQSKCSMQSAAQRREELIDFIVFLRKDDKKSRFVECLGVKQWNTSSAPESTLQYWTVPWKQPIDRSSLLHIPDQTEGASALYVFTPSVCFCTESPHMMKAVLFSDHQKFINDGTKNCYRITHNKKKQILRLCCRLLSHTGRPLIIHLSITDITDDIITCTGTITAGK